jgi:hypothetical protein
MPDTFDKVLPPFPCPLFSHNLLLSSFLAFFWSENLLWSKVLED